MSTATPFPRLFEPYTMNSVELRNRIVFAAHGSRFTDPHTLQLTPRQADYFVQRVKGGAGLIVQGSAIVVGCRDGPHRAGVVACLVDPSVGFEADWGVGKIPSAERPGKVVVIGGGPAGLKAAETAAMRGHEVIVLEAADVLGGAVLTAAAAMPYRDEFANSVRFLEQHIRRLGVTVRTGVRATAASVMTFEPDAVIVATGASPGRPVVPGADLSHVFDVRAAIEPGVVRLRDNHTAGEYDVEADAVVFSWFGVANDGLFHELDAFPGLEVRAIGDCLAPRRAIEAIWDGFQFGRTILDPEAESVGGPPLAYESEVRL